jgi:hypothetical protein
MAAGIGSNGNERSDDLGSCAGRQRYYQNAGTDRSDTQGATSPLVLRLARPSS